MPSATRRWLIVIVLAGAALRLYPIWFGLPFPQARPDEEVALGKAVAVIDGDLNPQFFHWPSLTFYVFAGVLWALGFVNRLLGHAGELTFADHALIARGVVALAGTATLVVLFHLARRIVGVLPPEGESHTSGPEGESHTRRPEGGSHTGGPEGETHTRKPEGGSHTRNAQIALLAAAFLAVAILHVRESHFAMTDVLMTLLVVTSLAHLARVAALAPATNALGTEPEGIPRDAVKWCAVAGLAGGLAASTKYSAAAVAASMAAAQLLWFVRTPRLVLSWRGWMPSLAYGAALVAGFLIGTPYAVLDYPLFSRDLLYDFTHLSQGHTGGNPGRGWIYHVTHSLPYGVGVPLFVAALVGIVPFARHYGRAAIVLGAFAAAFYLIIGSGYTVFFRYILPLVPLVCLSAAIGVSHAAGWASARFRVRPAVVLSGLVLITAGPALVQSVWFDVVLARTDTRVLAGQWLESRLQPDDSLHDGGSNYTRLDMWRASFHVWHYDEGADSFGDPAGRTPDWLVLHDSPLPAYASTPPALRRLAQSRYALVHVERARRRGGAAVYDPQDAFFMPLSGFSRVERPGPDIFIYRRRDLPPRGDAPQPPLPDGVR